MSTQTPTAGIVRTWAQAAAKLAQGFAGYAARRAYEPQPLTDEDDNLRRVRFEKDAERLNGIASWLERVGEGSAGVIIHTFDGMVISFYDPKNNKEA